LFVILKFLVQFLIILSNIIYCCICLLIFIISILILLIQSSNLFLQLFYTSFIFILSFAAFYLPSVDDIPQINYIIINLAIRFVLFKLLEEIKYTIFIHLLIEYILVILNNFKNTPITERCFSRRTDYIINAF